METRARQPQVTSRSISKFSEGDHSGGVDTVYASPKFGAGTSSFQFNAAWQSKSTERAEAKGCGKYWPPRLWIVLTIFFTCVVSVVTAVLSLSWYWQFEEAVDDMENASSGIITTLNITYRDQALKFIRQFHAQAGQIQDLLVKSLLDEAARIVDLNADLLSSVKQVDLDALLRYTWKQLSKEFRTVEGISYAWPSGLFVEYERDSHRDGFENTTTITFEFRAGEDFNATAAVCLEMCPPLDELTPNFTQKYTVDPTTGGYLQQYTSYPFEFRDREYYVKALSANGSLIWTEPYVTLQGPQEGTGGHSVALRAAKALLEDGEVSRLVMADITLDYVARVLTSLSIEMSNGEGVIFIIDEHGYMISSSEGMSQVVAPSTDDGVARRLLWNETGSAMITAAVDDIGGLAGLGMATELSRPYYESQAKTIPPGDDPQYVYSAFYVHNGYDNYSLHWVVFNVQNLSYYTREMEESIGQGKDALRNLTGLAFDVLRQQVSFSVWTWAVCVVLGMALIIFIARAIANPLRRVHKDMREFAKFDADVIDRVVANPQLGKCSFYYVSETAEICDSFAYMAAGLQSFARYMDAHLVQTLVRSKRQAQLGMALADVTIFFSDVAGFTTLAETMDTAVFMEVFGTYLEQMSEIVMKYGGVVGEFIGDAIMAWWNAPPLEYGDRHGEAAVAAALKQQERLGELNKEWQARDLPELRIRMGLAQGRVLSGNLGSMKRMKYGLVGDSVNLASRLESLCKRYGVSSLVEDNVRGAPGVAESFLLRPIDLVTVKGRAQPTELFELVSWRPALAHHASGKTPRHVVFCDRFADCHERFRSGDFQGALERLRRYRRHWPDDVPSRLLEQRCEELVADPPGPGWSPVLQLTEK